MCDGCGFGRFKVESVPPLCSAMSGCSCVRDLFAYVDSLVADRIVMAASRLLGATAACVIHLSFAAGQCESFWNGCIKAAPMICQQILSIMAVLLFLFIFLLKSASKSCLFLASRSLVLELQLLSFLCVDLLCFAIQSVQIAL